MCRYRIEKLVKGERPQAKDPKAAVAGRH